MVIVIKRVMDKELIESYLEKFELKDAFSQRVVENMSLHYFNKNELVCRKDQEMDSFYILLEGKIKIYTLHSDGKSLLLRFSQPASILGDVELMTGYKPLCNVECVIDSVFIAIDMDLLREEANYSFLKYLIVNLSDKLYSTTDVISISLLYPLETRLASYILATLDGETCCLPKLIELASLLGTSYRHLNRVIGKFEDHGFIDREGKSLRVLDRQALEVLSKGNVYEGV